MYDTEMYGYWHGRRFKRTFPNFTVFNMYGFWLRLGTQQPFGAQINRTEDMEWAVSF